MPNSARRGKAADVGTVPAPPRLRPINPSDSALAAGFDCLFSKLDLSSVDAKDVFSFVMCVRGDK